jgi:formate-dependent nitrite reductase membrane component NrfD
MNATPPKLAPPLSGAAHVNPRDAYRTVPVLKQPTWNHEVAAYFFIGGVSAGSALLGSIAELVAGERSKDFARAAHYVSFATLLPCPILLIDDLGKPERFHHMLRVFKPSSPMNLGSWSLLLHGAGATITVLAMLARERRLPLFGWPFRALPERLLATVGIPSSFVLAGYTGVLLGTTSIPVWYTSPLLGALFMSSSMSTGAAAIASSSYALDVLSERERSVLRRLVASMTAVEIALLMGYVATSGPARKPLLSGNSGKLLGASFALLTAGWLAELAALGRRASRAEGLLAALASLLGGALLRWAVVRAGRASAADREGTLQAMSPSASRPGWNRARG